MPSSDAANPPAPAATDTPRRETGPRAAPALPLHVRLVNAPFIALIWLYRVTLSRLTGRFCRFSPTCSQYALEAYQTYPPIRATRLTLWRLARCQPLARGGYDPVPLPNATPLDDQPPID